MPGEEGRAVREMTQEFCGWNRTRSYRFRFSYA